MSRKSFAAGALLAPTPPVLVTVGTPDQANIITIGWTGILATHPARTYISVRPSRYSYGILKECREFVINLPSAKLAREVDFCGIYTGAKVDKFEKCGFTKVESKEVAPPTIKECPVALECRVVEIIPMGTHDVFIADIVSVSCDEEILDKEDRICFDRADLLAYAHGEYFALGESLGKFGFSATKKKQPTNKPLAKNANKPSDTAPKKAQRSPAPEHKPFYLDIAKKGRKSHPVSKKRPKGGKK